MAERGIHLVDAGVEAEYGSMDARKDEGKEEWDEH